MMTITLMRRMLMLVLVQPDSDNRDDEVADVDCTDINDATHGVTHMRRKLLCGMAPTL